MVELGKKRQKVRVHENQGCQKNSNEKETGGTLCQRKKYRAKTEMKTEKPNPEILTKKQPSPRKRAFFRQREA